MSDLDPAREVPPDRPSTDRPSVPGERPSWPRRGRRFGRPVLASEALRDDVAPVEPGRIAARWFCAGYGVLLALFGAEALYRHGQSAWLKWGPAFVLAGIALVAAALTVKYVERARAMVILGALAVFVGIGGGLDLHGGASARGVLRLLGGSLLPAALIFRAQYRAFVGARWFLAAAIAAALPAVAADAWVIFRAPSFGLVEGVAAAFPLAVLASSVGFMGWQTTAAGIALAPTVIATLALEVFVGALGRLTPKGLALACLPAVAFAAAAGTLAIGLSQLLANRYSAEARQLDVRQASFTDEDTHDEGGPDSGWGDRG